MLDVQPRLCPSLVRERNSAGELVLIGNRRRDYLTVSDDEALALDLIDGRHSLHDIVAGATRLELPLRPMATLALIRKLHAAHLIEGLGDAAEELFGLPPPSPVGRLIRWGLALAIIDIPVPLVGAPLALGRRIPSSVWRPLMRAALGLFAVALLVTLLTGHLLDLLDPFYGDRVVERTAGLYLAASALLSIRSLFRGLLLASLGMAPATATIGIVCGVVHLGIDDRRRRAAAASERRLLALVGITSLCLLTALSLIAWAIEGHDNTWLRALAATALYLTVFDLAPYGRGDVWHLLGIATRIPDLTRRAAVFLLRRSLKNLARSEPIRRAERTYLLLAIAWIGHWILTLWLLTEYLVPGALKVIDGVVRSHVATGEVHGVSTGLGLAIALSMLAAVSLVFLGLLGVILSAVGQLLKPDKSTPPASRERIGARADELVAEMRGVPFLAVLPDEELRDLIAGMVRERHDDGAFVVRQGEHGDRFCLLHSGTCDVLFEEESGLLHTVAKLAAGDFFGEIALLEEVPRTATIQTTSEAIVYSLERSTFVSMVERSGFAREAVLDQVRNAAFLRTVPVFHTLTAELMSTLLAHVSVVREAGGETIVEQGDRGDAMYVIREGSCEVVRQLEGGSEQRVAELSAGDWFGEIALLRGIERTATVRTTANSVLVRVPGDVLDDVLLGDFRIGLTLERAMAKRLVALGNR